MVDNAATLQLIANSRAKGRISSTVNGIFLYSSSVEQEEAMDSVEDGDSGGDDVSDLSIYGPSSSPSPLHHRPFSSLLMVTAAGSHVPSADVLENAAVSTTPQCRVRRIACVLLLVPLRPMLPPRCGTAEKAARFRKPVASRPAALSIVLDHEVSARNAVSSNANGPMDTQAETTELLSDTRAYGMAACARWRRAETAAHLCY